MSLHYLRVPGGPDGSAIVKLEKVDRAELPRRHRYSRADMNLSFAMGMLAGWSVVLLALVVHALMEG